jgi:DNA-binding XRE family transcriptional regulator
MLSKYGIEMMDHTTPNPRDRIFLAPIITFTMLLGVGTGGDYTASYHSLRSERGAFSKPRQETGPGFAIAADIENTRSTLNLTMSELARCLSVSRQALYNWIAGGPIKPENLSKLNELKSAAELISTANLPDHPLLLRRKLPGGKTLTETVAAGGSGVDAARSLIEMAKVEAQQRAALAKRFADRRPDHLLGHGTPPLTDQS